VDELKPDDYCCPACGRMYRTGEHVLSRQPGDAWIARGKVEPDLGYYWTQTAAGKVEFNELRKEQWTDVPQWTKSGGRPSGVKYYQPVVPPAPFTGKDGP
jgi:hypothetical protein